MISTRNRHTAILLALLVSALHQAVALGAGSADELFRGGGALTEEPKFLPVDEAFIPSATLRDDRIDLHFEIHEGYYLYRHRLAFETDHDGLIGEAVIPGGHRKEDEYFGEVEVYYDELPITLPVVAGMEVPEHFTLHIEYQGCADAGLCYPPTRRVFNMARGNTALILPEAPQSRTAQVSTSAQRQAPVTEGGRMAETLASGSLGVILLLFFGAGIGLAFTPCVLPMVPILSSIIVGRREIPSRWAAFSLSLTYVAGMAVTYALLGTLVGYFGAEFNLQAGLQTAPVLILFALLFIALALAMFGVYELQLPEPLRDRLNRWSESSEGGEYAGVATMGVISSLVVSPCVSAPLAGALVYISTTGDALLGGFALLALGLGMGVPLLVIGTSGGELLPRAGAWMNAVKLLFGVMLLGVAIWMIERIVPPLVTMLLWSLLALGLAAALLMPRFTRFHGGGRTVRAIGIVAALYGVALMAGGIGGSEDALRPWRGAFANGEAIRFERVDDLTGLEARLLSARGERRPVIFDFYADWCVSCKVMERQIFNHPAVRPTMERFRLLQIDVTDNSPSDQAVLDHFGLFGPPAVLFFGRDGGELREIRVQGEIDREQFEKLLAIALEE